MTREEERRGQIAYMTSPGHVELRSYELPSEIEPRAALLRVLQTNVCGSDVHVFQGKHPIWKCGGMGHEMIGRVLKLGSSITTDSAGTPVQEGDRVVPMYTVACYACENCDRGVFNHCLNAFRYFGKTDVAPFFHGGTFATHYYLHEDQKFYRVPDAVSTQAAASANCAVAQVLYGLDEAQVSLGDNVVIQGAGGLGVVACAVARERGARVLVLDRVPARLEAATRFGADAVLNVDEIPELSDRVQRIQDWAGTTGADVVVEVTGIPAVFSDGLAYLRAAGTYLVMGTISIGQTTTIDPGVLVRKSARILGVNRYLPGYLHAALQFLDRVAQKYPFEEVLDRHFTLAQTQLAIEMSARKELQRATIVMDDEMTESPQ
jgi:threonine dehydrogenase-like Zn-dependent dehydrogenase